MFIFYHRQLFMTDQFQGVYTATNRYTEMAAQTSNQNIKTDSL